MSLFLSVIPLEEARGLARRIASPAGTEEVPLRDAAGRVLARDLAAREDIPGFARSTVDGYAVRAADTAGAGEAIPAILRLAGEASMGTPPVRPQVSGECTYVPTGSMLPQGADAVVMVEQTERVGGEILVKRPVAPGENVILPGEDFLRGSPILVEGLVLSPREIGVLAATGYTRVPVRKKPVIAIISTGDELVPVDALPGAGQVRDANGPMAAAFVEVAGCIPRPYGIVGDDPASLRRILDRALGECDAVFLSGGSSKDTRDLAAATIADLGEVLAHGIGIVPGKPTIIGRARGRPVLGLPGHPASAYIILHVLGGPLLSAMSGFSRGERRVPAVLAENIPSQKGRVEFVRVRLEDGKAVPCFGKSGLLNTFVASHGLVEIPAEREGLEAGETVEVVLW